MSSIPFSLAQIEAFACVCETNNLSTAAKRLQKSRTTVSELVETLEDNLGYILFNRQKRPLELTKEGHQLYAQARLFLHEANCFNQQARQIPNDNRKTLTICYDLFTAQRFIQQLIAYFAEQQIKINLLNIERHLGEKIILAGQADIGLYPAVNRMINADFKWRAIGIVELGIYAHQDFFMAKPTAISMLELASSNQLLPFIQPAAQTIASIKVADAIQIVTDINLLKQLLIEKQGWGLLPKHLFGTHSLPITCFNSDLGNKGIIQTLVAIWSPATDKQLSQIIQQIANLYETN
ncbi:LysR family transcriptional regulator [Utexia brackfieldae]|uniref:LysR family transcriptional regulator n=1 Tax=Utexia brackfieldae TaxID=3074108 RepID=UPI00370DDD5B